MKAMRFKHLIAMTLASSIVLAPKAFSNNALIPITKDLSLQQVWANHSFNLGHKIVNQEIVKGLNLSAHYKIKIDPNFKKSHQVRIDTWTLKKSIGINGHSLAPISIDKGSKIVFARQFRTKGQALKAKPYTFKNVPFKAKTALKNLQPGDMVSIPAYLNLSLGSNLSHFNQMGALSVNTKASWNYFVSGQMTVQVIRMPGQKVRLKLLASNSNGVSAAVETKVVAGLFAIEVLGNNLMDIHPLASLSAGIGRSKGAKFAVEYIFDLGDKEARKAYNQIMSSNLKFKNMDITRNVFGKNQLSGAMSSSIELAQKLAMRDHDKDAGAKVKRVFSATNNYMEQKGHLDIALLAKKRSGTRSYTNNNITYTDEFNRKHYYYYPKQITSSVITSGAGYKKFLRETTSEYFALLDRRKLRKLNLFPELSLSIKREDVNFTPTAQGHFRRTINMLLPNFMLEEIMWNHLYLKKNAHLEFTLVFKDSFFKNLPKMSIHEFKARLTSFTVTAIRMGIFTPEAGRNLSVEESAKKAIAMFETRLYHPIYNNKLDARTKTKRFMKLRNAQNFQSLGLGFLLSLMKEQQLRKHVYVNFELLSNTDGMKYRFGHHKNERLYQRLMSVQSGLNEEVDPTSY
jgi:hypothetical protein